MKNAGLNDQLFSWLEFADLALRLGGFKPTIVVGSVSRSAVLKKLAFARTNK